MSLLDSLYSQLAGFLGFGEAKMRPIQHKSNNLILSPPKNLTNDECKILAVTVIQYGNGILGMDSYWIPTPEELKKLSEGYKVKLSVLGTSLPPVRIGVESESERS